MRKKIIRHGDMALLEIDVLPDNLKKSKEKIFMTGSNNNPHCYNVGDWYPDPQGVQAGFFVSKPSTVLYHKTHGLKNKKKVRGMRVTNKIKPGIYQVLKQQEETHEGLVPVQD